MIVDGTSFSTRMVAGTAALLKVARPGLSVDQYRSLIIDNASDINNLLGKPSTIQQSGGGALNAWAALNSELTVSPASIGFGAGTGNPNLSQNLTISNVSTVNGTYSIAVAPAVGDQGPAVATNTIQLAPGASADVAVTWTGAGLAPGAHEGFIKITGAASGVETRIPYWYDVASGVPAKFSMLYNVGSGRRGSFQSDAVLFRITDSAGVPLTGLTPVVTVTSGGGSVRSINNYDSDVPGVYGITVRLGSVAGTNTLHIQAGDATIDASITGQ